MPKEFEEIAICSTLNITYNELLEQPAWWVMGMMMYKKVQKDAEKYLEEKQGKNKTGKL